MKETEPTMVKCDNKTKKKKKKKSKTVSMKTSEQFMKILLALVFFVK
jgi:hypothetical protein